MSKYLTKVTETYRADTEQEAEQIIKEAKMNRSWDLKKYASERHCSKKQGEIVDEWMRVTLTKEFCDEKEPTVQVSVNYTNDDFIIEH